LDQGPGRARFQRSGRTALFRRISAHRSSDPMAGAGALPGSCARAALERTSCTARPRAAPDTLGIRGSWLGLQGCEDAAGTSVRVVDAAFHDVLRASPHIREQGAERRMPGAFGAMGVTEVPYADVES